MALSGSQKAYMFAQGGVGRGGAIRGNFTSAKTFVSVGGTHRAFGQSGTTYKIRDLVIADILNEAPNTCSFTAINFSPTVGQDVIITIGSKNTGDRQFAGQILNVQQGALGRPANVVWHVNAIDYTWGLNKRKVTKKYTASTIAAIAADLITTFTSGYTVSVETAFGATSIDEISFTFQDITDALSQLAKRGGGYWLCDYQKVVRLFTTDSSSTAPTQLTTSHATLELAADVRLLRDLSQVITRVLVEGGGGNVLADVNVGETILPVDDALWYDTGGGVVVSGQNRITYTSRSLGGAGTLVGPGASPSSAPSAALDNGTAGVDTGAHNYAVTFVTGAGESLPGPTSTITTGKLDPPGSFTAGTPTIGTGPDPGSHDYAVTFVSGAGETTASASVTKATTTTADPTLAPGLSSQIGGIGSLAIGFYCYAYTFGTSIGETIPGPRLPVQVAVANTVDNINLILPGSSEVTQRKLYRTDVQASQSAANSATLKLLTTINDNTNQTFSDDGTVVLGAAAPGSSTAYLQRIPLSSIPLGPALVTSRKLYRTVAGGAQLKLLTTLGDNTTTTFTDTVTDASLGANVPVSNTADANHVSLTSIAIGGTGTTSRKVYRTAAGASQLKLLTTIADNTTTTFADTTADSGLGANAPTSDTSGLTQPAGSVLAGASSIIVAGTGAFSASGGWAVIGNGAQVVRYTGISGSSITGIPATGAGAITATVNYNSTITAAPVLTGIASSGSTSIQYRILKSDEVNLLAQVDNAGYQAALATQIGGDGIQEEYIQDRRLSKTEATARGNAILALRGQVQSTVVYAVRDMNARSGRTQSVSLAAPTGISGSFLIQQVQVSDFYLHPATTASTTQPETFPRRQVSASSTRFSFEDLLRQFKGSV